MYIERFTDVKGDLFIKFPLINNLLNDRRWRANELANEQYVHSAIGKPITVMLDKRESLFHDFHPFEFKAGASNAEHVAFARKYAYGEVVDVTRDSGKYKAASGEIPWFGIGKITDPIAKEELKKPSSKLIPPAFSPGIVQLAGPDDNITKYEILHIASVPSGAFGPKFVTIERCTGALATCQPQLRAASIDKSKWRYSGVTDYFYHPQTYKERTGCCPLDAFSSITIKSGSSNLMSDSTNSTPGPSTFSNGTQTISGPSGEAISTTSNANVQRQGKPTIRLKRPLPNPNVSREPNEENPDENENGEVPPVPDDQQSLTRTRSLDPEVRKEIATLRKQQEQMMNERKVEKTKYAVKDLLQTHIASYKDSTGRVQTKKFEQDLEKYSQKILAGTLDIETLDELLRYRSTTVAPEIRRGSSSGSGSVLGGIPDLKGASSFETDIEKERAEKCLRLNGGY